MDLDHPLLAGYSHMNEADSTPDPVPQRMSSGAHFNPVQFADQLAVQDEPTIPAVHQNPRGWYGETEQKDNDR